MSEATLVILDANVITLNPEQPKAEAIAIGNGKIIAVGTSEEIRKYVGAGTKVINASGKTAIPGLIDCHVHMASFGRHLKALDLSSARSVNDLQRLLRWYAERNPEIRWIIGRGWDHEVFSEKRYPTRWDLDDVVKDKPVFLIRVCGHVGVANSKALQLAGVIKRVEVKGGKVGFDELTGEPNGVLWDNAMDLIWKAVPKPSFKEMEEACALACRRAVEAGLTGVHWIVGSIDEVRVIQKLRREGRLPLRAYLGIPVDALDELINLGLMTGFGDDFVKIGFVKVFVNGSLGAHTAALKEPYVDKPETSGMLIYTQRKLNRIVLRAHKAGLQLAVHAIGDLAVESALNAFSKAMKRFPTAALRHRIEHCSVLNPRLIKRMKRLGLIASVQPHFVISDFWIVDRLGEARARWTYPFKTLMNSGVILVSGSDCPVEPINPLLGLWAAVARRAFLEESLTAEEALRTYTLNAVYASFDEDKRGAIEVGKLADITILSDDILSIPPDEILNVKVEMTIVNGEIVYQRERDRDAFSRA